MNTLIEDLAKFGYEIYAKKLRETYIESDELFDKIQRPFDILSDEEKDEFISLAKDYVSKGKI